MVLSKFESLPPELIVEIGDYLDGCDLYYTFHGLNQRIDAILDQQCHRLHISFIRITKIKFNIYCSQIVPYIRARVVSLTIAGDNSSTPGQLTLFLSRFKSLASVFIKLESLKLVDFTKSDVQCLLPHFSALTHLQSLSIGEFKRISRLSIDTDELFDENVILPISLRNLAFPYEISNKWIETSSSTSFVSVKRLCVYFIHINLFPSFLQRFPHLEHLTTALTNVNQNDLPMENLLKSTVTFHALRYLNINITQQVRFDHFGWFLRSVPQLHSLSLEAINPDIAFFEAHRWETILPLNLSSFRFDLTMTLPENLDHLELLKSFKSQFWISRNWFVQCRLRDRGHFLRLSTIQSPIITILYWPDDEILLESTDTAKYLNVTHIELWWNLSKSTHSICPNVRSIQLYGAGNENDDEPLHENVYDLLQCPLLEHIIINYDLPITQLRFASILEKLSHNAHILTCLTNWLHTILENKNYEWICLLLTLHIRKLILISNEVILQHRDLIAFYRTFINLQEITMKLDSSKDMFFLLNTLRQLTMAKIELPRIVLDNVIDITKWIQQNTTLIDFVVHKQINVLDTCTIILWICSRRSLNSLETKR